jgi:hypothetical protein
VTRAQRIRMRIAQLVDRLPGQCWSGLVDWIYDSTEDRGRGLPWSPQRDRSCRADVARVGGCYCGKLRGPGGEPS